MEPKAVGLLVQALREQRDWEQRELARRAGVSPSYISRLESGEVSNPKIYDLVKLADTLGVPVHSFLPERSGGAATPAERVREMLEQHPDLQLALAALGDELDDADARFLREAAAWIKERRRT